MIGPRQGVTGTMTLLAGAVCLRTAGSAPAQPGGWRSHIHIGPDSYDPSLPPNSSFNTWFPPDYGPNPASWYHWPTLREAIDQYGLFGRRAHGNTAGRFPTYPEAHDPADDLLPPPRLAEPAPTALLRVLVPSDADIWFDGRPTARSGSERLFVTPPLESGHAYAYEVQAQWPNGNGQVKRARTVRVYAGDRLTVDFLVNETGKGVE